MNSDVEGLREALRYWVVRYETAAAADKTAVAIAGLSWIVPNDEDQFTIRDFSAAMGSDVDLMRNVREMIWHIPKDHALFAKSPHLYDGIQTPGEWICDQLPAIVAIPGWERVRNLWLQRTHSERLATLLDLGATPKYVEQAPSLTDPLLRTAAWMIAEDDSLSTTAVVAATNITLHSYRNQYNVMGELDGPNQIQNAINITLARSQGAPHLYRMAEAEAQGILSAHPHACVRMLRFMDKIRGYPDNSGSMSRAAPRNGSSSNRPKQVTSPDTTPSSLSAWLPSRAATIGTMQMMGHSHQQILDHLVDALTVDVQSFALPLEIDTGTPA